MYSAFVTVTILAVVLGLLPTTAHAMHIAEGILTIQWSLLWFVLSVPFLALGLRELKVRSRSELHIKPLVGLIGSAVFVISCVPVPVPTAGTCSHMCGTGIAAVLMGPYLSVLVASVALALQALFLAHGGLTTLGANIFSMGVVGSFAGYGIFVIARRMGASWWSAVFLAGLIADWATYGATSLILGAALHGEGSFAKMFLAILVAFMPTQIPLGVLEGLLSAGAYGFIRGRRPDFLPLLARRPV